MKKIFIIVSLVATNAFATGIPVVDVSNLAQAIQQVAQLRQQLTQLQQMEAAVTGSRGMGALLNQPQLRQYLPTNTNNLYSTGATGSASLDSAISSLKQSESVGSNLAQERAALSQRQADTAIKNKAMTQVAYQAAMSRLDNIEALARKIDFASDSKASADLQNRLSSELSLIQSEQQRIALVSQLQANEDALIKQKAKAINQKALSTQNSGMPGF